MPRVFTCLFHSERRFGICTRAGRQCVGYTFHKLSHEEERRQLENRAAAQGQGRIGGVMHSGFGAGVPVLLG